MHTQDTSAPALFRYDDQTEVRVVTIDGEPWFVLADLCKVLGLTRGPSQVAERLDDGVRQTYPIADSLGRTQQATIVNEPGMYEVVIRSDKPEAVAFRRWITGTVLPEIRKTGGYGNVAQLSRRDILTMALEAEDRADREAAARVEAERQAAALAAPASAWTHMAAAAGDYAVGDAAKILSRDPNISIGRDRLFAFMSAEGWIYRAQDRRRSWTAYQTQVNCGRLVEKMGKPYLNERTGETELPAPTIRITAKGLAELHKRLGGVDPVQQMAVSA